MMMMMMMTGGVRTSRLLDSPCRSDNNGKHRHPGDLTTAVPHTSQSIREF